MIGTPLAISAYHHSSCEFERCSWWDYSIQHFQSAYLSVKSTLGQNCQMSVRMRAKKKAGIKLQYFCQYRDRKKTNQRTKLSIYILDTIESESTTRFKNRSSDRMMTSDWLVDVSDDRCTTNVYTRIQTVYVLLWSTIVNLRNVCLIVLFIKTYNMH